MLRRADTVRGFSSIELVIAVTVSSLIFIALAGMMVSASKSLIVSTGQAQRQLEASVALDRVVGVLRNAVYPITFTSDTDVRFTDVRQPTSTISRIWLSGERVMYQPDMSDGSDQRVLGEPVSGLTFAPDENPLIGTSAVTIQISYNYMNFRDYHPDMSQNATFVTSVFMRNTD